MGASFVIIVAGLRAGTNFLVPFALALFLAVLSMPLMFWLQLRRVPAPLAIALTMLVIGALFGAGTRRSWSQNMSGILITARNRAKAKGRRMPAPSRNPATTMTKDAPMRRKRAPGVLACIGII